MIDNKVEEIKKHVQSIMDILGIEATESNENTPLRVAKMYCNELFLNRNNSNIEQLNSQMKLFSNVYAIDTLIKVKDIPFYSICEHHWLPFLGKVSIAYIPDKSIIGLSKIPRVVKYFSKKPQLQESLTKEIGEYLFNVLKPKYLQVKVYDTIHTCVLCRGIESECNTETIYEQGSVNKSEIGKTKGC